MHSKNFFKQTGEIIDQIDCLIIEKMADSLANLRKKSGRLFFIGVGGGAGHASHAVNDFRKICEIECYSPIDNVSELTARTNDEGWDTVFSSWLETSKINEHDAVFVFSVGGGNLEKNISVNIVNALKVAKLRKALILGVVGRDGGYTKEVGDHVLIIPTIDKNHVTPHTEGFQAVVWHCLVSHPKLQKESMKWEEVTNSSEKNSD
tara:strand:+ start:6307 stop:6924 length:618 start_codon:yes stop_codon:yes gene_type:complete